MVKRMDLKTIMMCSSMKRYIRHIYVVLVGTLLVVGCQKDSGTPQVMNDGSMIYLSAVTEGHVATRVPYEYTMPNDSNDGVLHAAIWASSFYTDQEGYTFPNPNPPLNGKNGTGENANQVAIHATANFDSGAPQLLDQAVYPQSGTPVFFVGLHPQTGWQSDAEYKSASFTFDGSDDVMFAPRIEGKYADTSTSDNIVFDVPELKFWHMLTWLKVRMIAEDEQAMSAWGKITDIKVTSNNHVNIDINRTDDYIENGKIDMTCATFSNSDGFDGLLSLYRPGSNDIFPQAGGYELKYFSSKVTTAEEVAYVLCSPVNALAKEIVDSEEVESPEYVLHIETERRRVEVPIDLRVNSTSFYEGSTRAKCFTLNLNFKMGNTIVVTANVADWTLGGSGHVEL